MESSSTNQTPPHQYGQSPYFHSRLNVEILCECGEKLCSSFISYYLRLKKWQWSNDRQTFWYPVLLNILVEDFFAGVRNGTYKIFVGVIVHTSKGFNACWLKQ